MRYVSRILILSAATLWLSQFLACSGSVNINISGPTEDQAGSTGGSSGGDSSSSGGSGGSTGGSPSATLAISDQGHDYGNIATSSNGSKIFTVTNSGTGDAVLGTVSTVGLALGAPYTLIAGTCATGATLAASASCTLQIQFAPTLVGVHSETITLSYTGGSSSTATCSITGTGTGTAPPNASYLVGTGDSVSKASLFWNTGGGTTAGFKVAFVSGTTAPATCALGTVVDVGNVTTYQVTSGLTSPNTNYSFRVCAYHADGSISSGVTTTVKTLPVCDQTVSANETFAAFKTRIDAATDTQPAGSLDGVVTVCIADGVDITTTGPGEGDVIVLDTDNLYIRADRGDTARIRNQRTNDTNFGENEQRNSALFFLDANNFQMSNIMIDTAGKIGYCYLNGNGVAMNVGIFSNITCSTQGEGGFGISVGWNRTHTAMIDMTISTSGHNATAFEMNNGSLALFEKFSITTSGTGDSQGIQVQDEMTTIRNGTINNVNASGFRYYNGNTDLIDKVTVSTTNGAILRLQNSSRVDLLSNLVGTMEGHFNSGVDVQDGSSIGSFEDSVLTLRGDGSSMLTIRNNGGAAAHVDSIDNVQIKFNSLGAGYSSSAIAILDTSYVISPQVTNFIACTASTSTGGRRFEDHVNGASDGMIYPSPGSHNAYSPGTVTGAQTFPFSDLSGIGLQGAPVAAQNITLGGLCP